MENIKCLVCKETKSKFEFHKNRARFNGFDNRCKECSRERNRKRSIKNRSTIGHIQWASRKLQRGRINAEKGNYTPPYGDKYDVLKLWEECDGKCLICCNKSNNLCLDHCHATGKLRGFTCSNCNLAIGLFHDDPNMVLSAYEYLIKHSKTKYDSLLLQNNHKINEN